MSRSCRTIMMVLAGLPYVVLLWMPGCVAPSSSPYAPQSESQRDPAEAQRLTARAGELMSSDPGESERMLQKALTLDIYYGPAHNNLGVLYLKQGRLYEAASECEWARKLLPGLPEPRLNLALALERAGRTTDALETYRSALEIYPGHIQSMQAIARLQVRAGKSDETIREYLREIAWRGQDQAWRGWARTQLAFMDRP